MKRTFTCITFLFLSLIINAKSPFTLGLSWGFSPQVYKSMDFSYRTNQIGYRVSDSRKGFNFYECAYLSLDAGLNVSKHWSLHLVSGYRGVDENYNIVPLYLQTRFYFKEYSENGIFLGMGAGTALKDWHLNDDIVLSNIELGYREYLYKTLNLEFLIKLEGMFLHPLPIDKYEGVISRPQVLYSNVGYIFIGTGFRINF